MTGTRRFEPTFQDLAVAVGLNYRKTKKGMLVADLPMLLADEILELHYQEASMYGPRGGMRRIPRVIYEILRHTIMPSTAVEESAIGWPFLEIIYVVMSGDKLNLLDLMVNHMLECKRDMHAPLALQPYIMALVLHTVKDFYGVCEV
jgi:hypothetical protein